QQLQQLQQLQQRPQQVQPAARPAAELAAAERNEFQEFIAASTGKKLPIFGFNLFEAPSTFAPVENIPVTGDYVIGPGDELLVRAWGQIDVDFRAIVDRNGMVNIPRVGSIPVAGVRYQDLTSHVRTAVSRNFRNFELLVTMGQLRSVQIFVVGAARRPGAYTVSSLSTLVNAVFAAGGPSEHGSMRAIQLKRGNSPVTELDYAGLKRPIKDGDLVSILSITPRFENAVTPRGNVAQPLRYPWREGLRVRDLIPEKEALITPDYYRRQNSKARVEAVTQGQLA